MAGGYQPAPYTVSADDSAKCPACGLMNDADAQHCDQCGAPLMPTASYVPDSDQTVACPECDLMNDDDASYCSQCGAQLAGSTDVQENSAGYAHLEQRSGPPREGLIRSLTGCEVRDSADSISPGTLTGYLARFNQWAEINSAQEGHFLERLQAGSFARTIANNRGQLKCTFQHGKDPQFGDKPLGPITELAEDDQGVRYSVELLPTQYNRELAPGLKAGLYGSSFRFNVVAEDFNQHAKKSDFNPRGLPERTVREVFMQEFGPVTYPAYQGATAGMRSLARVAPSRGRDFLSLIDGTRL
jgi:HK97 family phage prohead protease